MIGLMFFRSTANRGFCAKPGFKLVPITAVSATVSFKKGVRTSRWRLDLITDGRAMRTRLYAKSNRAVKVSIVLYHSFWRLNTIDLFKPDSEKSIYVYLMSSTA